LFGNHGQTDLLMLHLLLGAVGIDILGQLTVLLLLLLRLLLLYRLLRLGELLGVLAELLQEAGEGWRREKHAGQVCETLVLVN